RRGGRRAGEHDQEPDALRPGETPRRAPRRRRPRQGPAMTSDRPTPSDADGEARDAAVIDVLYDETGRAVLDPATRDAADALAPVRAMFAELPDEDPPAGGAAQLLLAAQAQVARSPLRWVVDGITGLFRSTLSSPALAAATSMVVVVGIAGVLYLRGGLEVATPQAVAPAPAPTAGTPEAAGSDLAAPTAAEDSRGSA